MVVNVCGRWLRLMINIDVCGIFCENFINSECVFVSLFFYFFKVTKFSTKFVKCNNEV